MKKIIDEAMQAMEGHAVSYKLEITTQLENSFVRFELFGKTQALAEEEEKARELSNARLDDIKSQSRP